ncbi:MAG: ABC transporter substrate-binding protein, partial [Candidatus Edwardsbacteria bacterium]|nr:ABC transporter substrate-binding protein [Candidatus Edwardsbacteria bacterium]
SLIKEGNEGRSIGSGPAPAVAVAAPAALPVAELTSYLALVGRFTALLPAIMQGVDALNQASKRHFANISAFSGKSGELFTGMEEVVGYSTLVLETSADYEKIILRTEEILQQMLASVEQTLAFNDQAEARLRELVETTDRLQALVSLLGDLSIAIKQLSRNAEIKAYHAGSAGRGFSVIAENMNRLAGQMEAKAGEIPAAAGQIRDRLDRSLSGIGQARAMALALKERADQMRQGIAAVNNQNQRVIAEFDAIRAAAHRQMEIKNSLLAGAAEISAAASRLGVAQELVATVLSTETAEVGQIDFIRQQEETALRLSAQAAAPWARRELSAKTGLLQTQVREAESRWRNLQDSMAELTKTSGLEERVAGTVWENLEKLFDNINAIGGNLETTGGLLAANKNQTAEIASHLDQSDRDLKALQATWGEFRDQLAAIARMIEELIVSAGYLKSFTEEIKLLSFYESVEVADLGSLGKDFMIFVDQTRDLALQAKNDSGRLAPLFEDVRRTFGGTDRIIGSILAIIGDNLENINQARWSLERSGEAAGQFELIGQEAGTTIGAQKQRRQEVYEIYTAYSGSYKQVEQNLSRLLDRLNQGFASLSELGQADGALAGIFGEEQAAARGGTLRLTLSSDPITLDPAMITDATSDEVVAQVFNGLVQFDDGVRVMPAIARYWTISADGLSWTFYLRRGVKFHHGRELAAGDVKYSLERLLDPQVKSSNALFVDKIRGAAEFRAGSKRSVDGIKIIDDHCLQIVLTQPYMPFLANLAVSVTAIVPRELAERPEFGRRPVGAGPFRFVDWQPGKSVVLERFEQYYEQRISAAGIHWMVGLSEEQRLAKLVAGEADAVDIHERDRKALAGRGSWTVKHVASLNVQYLCINVSLDTPFKHKLVRQALNYAIDKQALIDATELKGEAIAATGVFPPRLEVFNPDLTGYPYDPQKARERLEQAGFNGGLPGEYLLDIRDIKAHIDRGEMVKQYCKKVGIRIRLNPLSWKDLLDRAYNVESLLSFRGWASDNGDPDNFLTPLFLSRNWGKPGNTAFFKSEEIDAMLDKALAIRNPVERQAYYREIEAAVVDEAPWVFLYHSMEFIAMQPKLHGYRVRPFGAPRLKDCWLEE